MNLFWERLAVRTLSVATHVLVALVAVESVALAFGQPFVVHAIESVLGAICHHDPARTLILGELLPVCARCTGLYLGSVLGMALWYAGVVRITRRTILAVSVAFLLAIVVAVIEWVGPVPVPNAARVVLGLPLGIGPVVGVLMAADLMQQIFATPPRSNTTVESRPIQAPPS